MFEMRYMGLPKGSSICFQPQCEPGSLTPGPFEPESLTPGSFQPQLWYNFIDLKRILTDQRLQRLREQYAD